MKIFLSWSGERSKFTARALRDWLPLIFHYAQPWLSEKDISAGDRWGLEIGRELEECSFGIVCLTQENVEAPWILFEAGALSKIVSANSVCPYLLDIEFSDIGGPLSQFQAKKAEKASTFELVQAINAKALEPIISARLSELFEVLWPKLDLRLQEIPSAQQIKQAIRTQTEVLEELVTSVRDMVQRIKILEDIFMQELLASWRSDHLQSQLLNASAKPRFITSQASLEKIIATIWQDTLGIKQVDVDDNFFDVGGHSLLLTRVASIMREVLGREISLRELFEHPTVRSLSEHLSQKQGDTLTALERP
jgi:acyl carrier protein